jgi:hypothetical protein
VTVDAAHHDRAMSDPAGLVTELVTAKEHQLGRDQVHAVVAAVAGGRAKSRRLALALAGRPAVLADGRSPAPRAVANLLVALHDAGARDIPAAGLRPVRKASQGLPAPRSGLVLHALHAARRAVRRMQEGPARRLPGPGRPAAVREVPGRRRA